VSLKYLVCENPPNRTALSPHAVRVWAHRGGGPTPAIDGELVAHRPVVVGIAAGENMVRRCVLPRFTAMAVWHAAGSICDK
jgi:hypothetical protein